MKFRRTVLAVSISAAITTLSACGGGGGGPNSQQSINNQVPVQPLSQVPFHTPTRVGSITPVNTTVEVMDQTTLFSQNLSGSGQELIVAGRMDFRTGSNYSTYNLSIFGWSNGQLINKTSQWFSGTDNQIIGNEANIKFADFNGDGKIDMYSAPYSDTNIYGFGSVFFNNGSSFTRTNLNFGADVAGHDSAIYDFNNDGLMDILTMNYGNNVAMSFGNRNSTFTTYINQSNVGGGSGVAVADFLGNGTSTMIMTDSYRGINKLVGWSITNNNLNLTDIGILPTPRFLLPKWSSYNFDGNHDVRALAFDFDNSGRMSAIILSRPWLTNNIWPEYSEVQFLKNQGNGVFTDVTDNVLIGYNTSAAVSYNPKLMDVNSDGLIDIVLSSPNWVSNDGSQVLIHTADHKYVASYATVLKAFQDQANNLEKSINTATINGANGIVFIQGPDGDMYLATGISYKSNGVLQKAIYLSKLGASVSSAQATADTIRQRWPWMSDGQVNTVLAQSSTTWFGLNVLDETRALSPIGALNIMSNGRAVSLQGHVSGINLNGSANQITVLDSVGRDFNINYSSTSILGKNMFSRFVDAIDDDTRGAQLSGMEVGRYNGFKFGGTADNRNMAIGVTGIELANNVSLSAQYSRMPFSPFVQLNGSWGLVKSSDTVESTVSYRNNQFVGKLGTMYSTTEIQSGLVNRINPITSVWAEVGYEWSNFRAYTGMLPKVLSGSANLTLPTGIDNQGHITYTNTQANVYSPTVTYARFSYTERVNKTVSVKLNGMVTSQQQTTVIGEVKVNF